MINDQKQIIEEQETVIENLQNTLKQEKKLVCILIRHLSKSNSATN